MALVLVCLDRSPFSPVYYHPLLNYSVAVISITPAILYLALPVLTASTFHSKYCTNIPDKRKDTVAVNQEQLVAETNKRLTLFPLGLSILKSRG